MCLVVDTAGWFYCWIWWFFGLIKANLWFSTLESECRRKWKTLRDQHRRERQREKERRESGIGLFNYRPWRYSSILSFLNPFIDARAAGTNGWALDPQPSQVQVAEMVGCSTTTETRSDDDESYGSYWHFLLIGQPAVLPHQLFHVQSEHPGLWWLLINIFSWFDIDLVLIVLSVFRVRRSWRDHDDILVLILRVPAEEAATLRRLGPVQAQRSKGWGELRRHRHWRRPADAAARQHEGAVWDDDALGDISCYDLSFVTLFLADPSSAAGSAESSSQPAAVLDRGAAEPAEDRGAGRRRGRAARPNGRWGGGGGRAPPRFSQAAPAKEEERQRPAGGIPDEDRSQGCTEGAWHGAEGRRDAVPAEPGSGYEETDSRETVMGPNQDAAVSARGRVWRHKVPVSPRTFWWKLIQRGRTESSL